jgi:hypothetical protein
MDRGDVYLATVDLPNRATGGGSVPTPKYLLCLRGDPAASSEDDVPILLASTDRRNPGQTLRKFEVGVGVTEGFDHDTVIDCRWPYTLLKSQLPRTAYRFTLPTTTMDKVNIALIVGLQMYQPRPSAAQPAALQPPTPEPPPAAPRPAQPI